MSHSIRKIFLLCWQRPVKKSKAQTRTCRTPWRRQQTARPKWKPKRKKVNLSQISKKKIIVRTPMSMSFAFVTLKSTRRPLTS